MRDFNGTVLLNGEKIKIPYSGRIKIIGGKD